MKLTYIYNSGYVIENDGFAIVVDYYKDSADEYVKRLLSSFRGKIYVLASHWHPDHFNRRILNWKDERPDIRLVLSKDILDKRFAGADVGAFVDRGDTWDDGDVSIKAFGSTDVGVSFLIETDGRKIFHAGDLNNWHWDEESTAEEVRDAGRDFLNELEYFANYTKQVDLAMFPVDYRLGKNYMLGAEQFVSTIKTAVFAPMHFGERYNRANAFRDYAEKSGCRFVAWTKTGESINF
ncbi:MAG: MBL fold metallo-hydrolase [Tannerella sp.]|jgi:L-ascorbate metabolism protein UlaG (beta-lactamase superfamily)|nr:MBL fold metallo-hydrolase [Tannerella sp.]